MSIFDAIGTGCLYLSIFGLLGAAGLLAVQTAAWIWYRRDGGRKKLIDWLREI